MEYYIQKRNYPNKVENRAHEAYPRPFGWKLNYKEMNLPLAHIMYNNWKE